MNAYEATAPSLRGRGQNRTVVRPVRALLSFPSSLRQEHMVDQFSEEARTITDEQLPYSAWIGLSVTTALKNLNRWSKERKCVEMA